MGLPFHEHQESGLGESKNQAVHRFLSQERRMQNNPDLKQQYINFMHEYESLGHMEKIISNDSNTSDKTYYLPHHAVVKESSTTTKLRVVFDASANASDGKSLNDRLLVGPTVQENLVDILLRFRKHQVPLTADIAKMYRQVLVRPQDRCNAIGI